MAENYREYSPDRKLFFAEKPRLRLAEEPEGVLYL